MSNARTGKSISFAYETSLTPPTNRINFSICLARIVKGSVRYNAVGQFNQSPDNRRSGMQPLKMRQQIMAVSELLSSRTTLLSSDFRDAAASASEMDVL